MSEPDPRLRKVATDFWFAVQRLVRRRGEPPLSSDPTPDEGPEDDGTAGSGVRRRPPDSSGSASAAVSPEPQPDERSGDIGER